MGIQYKSRTKEKTRDKLNTKIYNAWGKRKKK